LFELGSDYLSELLGDFDLLLIVERRKGKEKEKDSSADF